MEIKGKATVKYNNGASISPKGKLTVTDIGSICSIEGGGKIDFDNIKVDNFTYKGKVVCISITAKDNVSISGAVEAEKINAGNNLLIVFSNNIKLKDICASKIEVRPIYMGGISRKSLLLTKLLSMLVDRGKDIHAKFKRIQASDVNLTDCDADVIVCDKIKLSGKCKINQLICRGNVKIVGNDVKIHSQEKNN